MKWRKKYLAVAAILIVVVAITAVIVVLNNPSEVLNNPPEEALKLSITGSNVKCGGSCSVPFFINSNKNTTIKKDEIVVNFDTEPKSWSIMYVNGIKIDDTVQLQKGENKFILFIEKNNDAALIKWSMTVRDAYIDPLVLPEVGIELIDNKTWHIWNTKDDYYISKGGFQLTNHYQQIWTNNTLCVGSTTFNTEICGNSLPWGWTNMTDNTTFVNLTGIMTFQAGPLHTAELALEYYLTLDAPEIRITPKWRGTGTLQIPNVYMKINTRNIQVNMSTAGNTIFYPYANFTPNEFNLAGLTLKVNETNFTSGGFWYELWNRADRQFLRFRGEDYFYRNGNPITANPQIHASPQTGWANSQVNLTIPFGNINSGDSLSYTFYWIDEPDFGQGYDNNSIIDFYNVGGGTVSRIVFWNVSSGTWTTETRTNDTASSTGRPFQKICTASNKREAILINQVFSINDQYFAQIMNSSGIQEGDNITLSGTPDTSSRSIDCAYESVSGTGMVVFVNRSSGNLAYLNWSDPSWSSTAPIIDPDTGDLQLYTRLISNPISDEIILITASGGNRKVHAEVWNGSVWENAINLTDNSNSTSNDTAFFDCAYEGVSNLLRCFYFNGTGASSRIDIGMMTWDINARQWVNRTNYTLAQEYPAPSNGNWIEATSSPTTNEIIVLAKGEPSKGNLTALIWSGTGFTEYQIANGTNIDNQTSPSAGGKERPMNVVYRYFTDNSTTIEALIVWARNNNSVPAYSVWNSTVFSTNNGSATDVGGSVEDVYLTTNINGIVSSTNYWAFLATDDDQLDCNAQNFNSTTWSAVTEITATCVSATLPSTWIEWLRIDNTTPVFRSIGTNESSGDDAINTSASINLNATIRDNFQLDCAWVETNETGSFVNYTDGTRINCTSYVASSYWQYANITWQNNSINSNRTIAYNFCANDTNNNKACSGRREFVVSTSPPEPPVEPNCVSGQSTPAVSCSSSCVTLNLAFRIGGDKNNVIHTGNSTCSGLNFTTSGFGSITNKFISGERNNAVLGIVFAGSTFYHTYFDTNYSSAAYLIQMKQAAKGNRFLITFTNGTYQILDSSIARERDKIPGRTLGDIAKSFIRDVPLYLISEFYNVDLYGRIRFDGAVKLAIKNNGLVNGIANITLSLLSGG